MSEQKKRILLVGAMPLSIGYLQAYLEQDNNIVDRLILDDTVFIHQRILSPEVTKRELLATLKNSKYRALTSYIIEKTGGSKSFHELTAEKIATVFNELLIGTVYLTNGLFKKEEIRYSLDSGRIVAANRMVLQKIYPETFKNILENEWYLVQEKIKSSKPSIVGIQLLPVNRYAGFSLIERIHNEYPQIAIIVGGVFATSLYRQILQQYPFVIVVRGEGEQTLADLIRALSLNTPLYLVDGIAFMQDGNCLITKDRALFEKLDALPFPYQEIAKYDREPWLALLTARGCTTRCSFCCLNTISPGPMRIRSVANIIAELDKIRRDQPQVRSIGIVDSTFLFDNARVIEFCEEVIKRKFPFSFFCAGRVKPLSLEMIKKMEQAGFTQIDLGLESANEEILRKAHKGITQTDVLNAVKLFAQSKIDVRLYLIVGLPGETWATIRETAKFIQKLQKIKYVFPWTPSAANVFPGTELYENMCAAGLLDDMVWLNNLDHNIVYTCEHDKQTLEKMRRELMSYVELEHFFTLKGFLRQFPVVIFSADRWKIVKRLWYLGRQRWFATY